MYINICNVFKFEKCLRVRKLFTTLFYLNLMLLNLRNIILLIFFITIIIKEFRTHKKLECHFRVFFLSGIYNN